MVSSSQVQRSDGTIVSTAPARYAKCFSGTGTGLVNFNLPDGNSSVAVWIECSSVDTGTSVSFDDGASWFALSVGDSIDLEISNDHVQILGAYRMIVTY